MKFALAKPCKWRIIYTIDSDPEKIEYLRVFNFHPSLWKWMSENEDKTIVRMSIMYDYPNS